MKQTKKREEQKGATSTKELILSKALEMINERGVLDFRIDVLAMSLNLSPGNITYHFARKEDISIALWHRYVENIERIASTITPILDLKQAFLIFNAISQETYNMRGVVMFASSDHRVLSDKAYNSPSFYSLTRQIVEKIYEILTKNNFLVEDKERFDDIVVTTTLLLRWWINRATIESFSKECDTNQSISFNTITILYTLYSLMTKEGCQQFDFLLKNVEKNNI